MSEHPPTPPAELADLRKRLAQLEEIERQHATLLSNLPGMVYRCRNQSDWPMEFVSDGCRSLVGHEPAELVDGRVVFGQLIHADDRQSVWNQVQEALAERRPFQLVYRLRSAAGEEKWVWEQGRGIWSGDQLQAVEGFVTDITDRKRAGLALRGSEERFRALVDKSHDVVTLMDSTGQCLYISPSVTRMLGYSVEEIVGGSSFLPVHPEDLDYAHQKFAEALQQPGQAISGAVRYRHQDGSYRYIEGVLVNRLEDPNVRALVCNYRDITDQRLAEDTLRASEQHYRMLFERNLAGVFHADLEGKLADCNDSFAHMLGYNDRGDALAGAGAGVWYDDDERQQFLTQLRDQVVLTGHESRLRRKDGGLVWALTNVSLLMTQDGPLVEGTLIDITERKRMERELARERDFFSALMDHTPLCIYFKDADCRFTRINQASAANLGLAQGDDALGTSDFDYFPEDQALEYYADEQRIMQTGEPLVGKLERQPRTGDVTCWFLTTKMPVYGKDGRIVGVVGISTEISEQKRVEEALQASLTLLRAVIEGTMDAVFVKDQVGRYVMINTAGAALIGQPVEQILGRADSDLIPEEAARRIRGDDLRVMASGEKHTEERTYKLNGGRRSFLVTQSPYRDHLGNIIGVIGVSHDITERKRLEEQLRQAQKMEAIGQLAGGVAHDFNNLLTAILGNVSLLSAGVAPGDPNRDLLRDTERAAVRAAELTSQLLGFSRQTMLRLESVDVTSVIEEAVGIVRRTFDPRVQVEVVCRPNLWTVQADPGQLTQVLMNLCLNARDAMPQGGLLRLETTHAILDGEAARQHLEARPGEFVRLRVADTGQGIPADIRPRIFDPFFTTKGPGKGTGLGLAMVFGIVKQHHGWIECVSEVGKGTHFDIYLPHHHSQAAPALTPVSPTPRGGSETILLVDDEAIIRNLGRTILQRYGYTVLLAEDGLEALKLYRQHPERIDLVILDLVMPRLSGHDTLRQLTELDPDVRVLFSSGYSAEQVTETERDGVLGFVHKPYRPQELAHKVRTLLDELLAARSVEPEREPCAVARR